MRKLQQLFFNVQSQIETAIFNKQWDSVNKLRKVSAKMSKCLDSGKISTSQLEKFQTI